MYEKQRTRNASSPRKEEYATRDVALVGAFVTLASDGSILRHLLRVGKARRMPEYRTDASFRYLLREEFINLAHFEKFANGRPFTLVENRKFHEYLRRNRDSRNDPRDPSSPSDPFDAELEAI
jgi:hypothetical protein